MEMFGIEFKKVFDLTSLLQSAFAGGVFAFLIWLGRILYRLILNSYKGTRLKKHRNEIVKIILHSSYIKRNGMYYFTQGYLHVIFKALNHTIKGFLLYFLFNGTATLTSPIIESFGVLEFLGVYFCIQQLINAYSWVNPNWASESLENYDRTLVEEIIKQFQSTDAMRGDSKSDLL